MLFRSIFGGQYMAPDRIDLRWISAILTKNGAIEETGVTAAVLGHPANSVAVLANMLAADGLGLVKGDVVLTGSFTRQVYVQAGDVIHADFGPLGAFAVSFV